MCTKKFVPVLFLVLLAITNYNSITYGTVEEPLVFLHHEIPSQLDICVLQKDLPDTQLRKKKAGPQPGPSWSSEPAVEGTGCDLHPWTVGSVARAKGSGGFQCLLTDRVTGAPSVDGDYRHNIEKN